MYVSKVRYHYYLQLADTYFISCRYFAIWVWLWALKMLPISWPRGKTMNWTCKKTLLHFFFRQMPQPLVKLGHLCGKNVTSLMSSRPIPTINYRKKVIIFCGTVVTLHRFYGNFFLRFEGLINTLLYPYYNYWSSRATVWEIWNLCSDFNKKIYTFFRTNIQNKTIGLGLSCLNWCKS